MAESTFSPALANLFANATEPEPLFTALLPAMSEALQSDRCFLLVRNPHTRIHRNFCWRRSPDFPNTETDGWQPEQEWEKEDPMFAAALRTAPPIFVDDIETAPADVLNVEFERNCMGHRALVHAHIAHEGQLWGILQPCMFDTPREWTERDRAIIIEAIDRLRQPVVDYVTLNAPDPG